MAGVPMRTPLVTMGFSGSFGNGVFVDRHVRSAQCGFGFFASDAFGAQIHQHHMALGAAADDAQTALGQGLGNDLGVFHHLLLVALELRLPSLL
jgi:hypothetical protein